MSLDDMTSFHYTGRLVLGLLMANSTLFAAEMTLMLRNGRIWTGDAEHPWAEAIGIVGNRITVVGTNTEVASHLAKATRVIDLGGKLASPGFNDAHTHFLEGSLQLSQVDLFNAGSLPEMQKRIAAYAKSHPDAKWITGAGWEYGWFPGGRLPTKDDLDKVVGDRPVYLKAYDGHTGWVNSEALRRADVNAATKFPGYGEIVKDAQGQPTGCLKENAQTVVRRLIPAPTHDQKIAALLEGQKMAARLGITSIQNASGDEDALDLYRELYAAGKLAMRVSCAISVSPGDNLAVLDRVAAQVSRHAYLQNHAGHDPDWPHPGSIKIVMDGVIESHTAAMLEPYADGSNTSGSPNWTQAQFDTMVARAAQLNLQVYTHAIGDRAVRMTLDGYERALKGDRTRRWRIEHIETISPDDIPRFAKLGVLPSMQPIHADPESSEVWDRAVGPKRLATAFAWRDFEKSGATLVFSSDWPAAITTDPIRGIHCAVTRQTADGQPPGGWVPHQRVSLETALRAYTLAGAYASFEERSKGQLKPGMLADVIVFSRDLFRIPATEIAHTQVALTVFDGKVFLRSTHDF
jgi:predicted amidohydrolase YtcJ